MRTVLFSIVWPIVLYWGAAFADQLLVIHVIKYHFNLNILYGIGKHIITKQDLLLKKKTICFPNLYLSPKHNIVQPVVQAGRDGFSICTVTLEHTLLKHKKVGKIANLVQKAVS